MNLARMLVWQLGVEDFLVAFAYLCGRHYARAVYWMAAGTITLSTLFMK